MVPSHARRIDSHREPVELRGRPAGGRGHAAAGGSDLRSRRPCRPPPGGGCCCGRRPGDPNDARHLLVRRWVSGASLQQDVSTVVLGARDVCQRVGPDVQVRARVRRRPLRTSSVPGTVVGLLRPRLLRTHEAAGQLVHTHYARGVAARPLPVPLRANVRCRCRRCCCCCKVTTSHMLCFVAKCLESGALQSIMTPHHTRVLTSTTNKRIRVCARQTDARTHNPHRAYYYMHHHVMCACPCRHRFMGEFCEQPRCPNLCGGNGVCQPVYGRRHAATTEWRCSCYPGFYGADCAGFNNDLCPSNCSCV